jgi:hypothetical protein
VRLKGIQAGDIVEVDRPGRRFHALVVGSGGASTALSIQPRRSNSNSTQPVGGRDRVFARRRAVATRSPLLRVRMAHGAEAREPDAPGRPPAEAARTQTSGRALPVLISHQARRLLAALLFPGLPLRLFRH